MSSECFAKAQFKNKIEKQLRMDKTCPSDQHFSQENLTN